MEEPKLTPKQALFIAEYLVDGNATRAAIAAGFSPASADVTGAKLLRNAKIAKVLRLRQARRAAKLEITAERVLQELAKLAFYDPGDLFDADGNVRALAAMNANIRAAVASLETERRESKMASTVIKKIRLADKGTNLERLGKHLKLFGDGSNFGATVEMPGGMPSDSTIKIVLVRPE